MAREVWINCRFVCQALTGVQRYAVEVIRRLPLDGVKLLMPCKPKEPYSKYLYGHDSRIRTCVFQGVGAFGHLWEQLCVPPCLPSDAVLWTPTGSGPLFVRNQVVTIHDVAHLVHPEWYDAKFTRYYAWLLPRLVRRVRRILTVSDFSKRSIVETLNVSPDSISVTPLGVDPKFCPQSEEQILSVRAKYGLKKPYMLTVSSLSPRKNLRRLVEAWSYSQLGKELLLVVVGARDLRFAGKARDLCSILDTPSVLYLGYVSDDDLPALYSGAIGSAFLSLYEGFGLPVLESMACGCAVLASNVTALPEVVGDAGFLVDPFDVEAIAYGLRRLVEDETLRKELRRKGLQRSQGFRWERTAAQTWEVLRSAGSE